MFVRIFQYRVLPQLRDRHLAVQQRAARLYGQHTARPPQYLRRGNDPHVWVELHWYPDRETCRRVAEAVAHDNELMKLWHEFQETLDPAFPVVLEEFDEYEVPAPPSTSPWAQPPIDNKPAAPAPITPPPAITLPPAPPPPAPSSPPPANTRWTMVAPSIPPVGHDSRQTVIPSRDEVMEVVDDHAGEQGT